VWEIVGATAGNFVRDVFDTGQRVRPHHTKVRSTCVQTF
jgi:hypothetical protein